MGVDGDFDINVVIDGGRDISRPYTMHENFGTAFSPFFIPDHHINKHISTNYLIPNNEPFNLQS